MLELFARGGWTFMLPLLIASITVIAITVERWLRFRRCEVDYDQFHDHVVTALRRSGPRAAQRAADEVPGPVARVWSVGLQAVRFPLPMLRERMEAAALVEVTRLERHVPWLGVIAQVAPLVGLLGTVWGMIVAFRGVEGGLVMGAGVQGEVLAAGIWKALITTAAGLTVAIPALLARHILERRIEGFLEVLERSGPDLQVALMERRAARAVEHPEQPGPSETELAAQES